MSLAKRLKELRKVKKISQRELAKILKISSGAVGMYETGKREPDYELLCKIADYFGVTTDYIFCRTDDPAPPQARKKEYSYEEFVLSAPSLDKAAIRINELYESYIINKEYALNLHRLAYEKYGLPPAPGSEPAAHHVSGKPATGVFDDDKK